MYHYTYIGTGNFLIVPIVWNLLRLILLMRVLLMHGAVICAYYGQLVQGVSEIHVTVSVIIIAPS